MTLYDLIMNRGRGIFTKRDWARLGKQEIKDEETIKRMLMEGYEAIVPDDDE